jgi:hypothetical protein
VPARWGQASTLAFEVKVWESAVGWAQSSVILTTARQRLLVLPDSVFQVPSLNITTNYIALYGLKIAL